MLEQLLGLDRDAPSSRRRCGQIVLAHDFLDDNYLSTEFRVPVTLLETNACSPLATNAIAGNIWDNFSSQSYKDLPSVGEITWYHPYTGEPQNLHDAGRRPRLHAAGLAHQPLVDRAVPAEQQRRPLRIEPVGRGADAIVPGFDRADALAGEARQGQPARRQDSGHDRSHAGADLPARGRWATCPTSCRGCRATGSCRRSSAADGIDIGPIPTGTPIGLLANVNLLSEDAI